MTRKEQIELVILGTIISDTDYIKYCGALTPGMFTARNGQLFEDVMNQFRTNGKIDIFKMESMPLPEILAIVEENFFPAKIFHHYVVEEHKALHGGSYEMKHVSFTDYIKQLYYYAF